MKYMSSKYPAMTPVTQLLSDNLKYYRTRARKKHFDFQVDMVCGPATICNIENLKHPTCYTPVLSSIAKYLGITLDELLAPRAYV